MMYFGWIFIMSVKVLNYAFEGFYTSTGPVKKLSGVYVIADCRAQGDYLLDVGESGNLRNRLDGHDRKDCWKSNCIGTAKAAILYTNEANRKRVADEIRDRLNPTCGVH